jgi:hypothetical protein
MNNLKAMFSSLPNVIYMGDFNTHASNEPGYEYLTQSGDTSFTFDDPPFHPDGKLTYPDMWHSGNSNQAYFTTTTRATTEPNSCGTTGGAKDWYDHILLSPWIVNGTDNVTYLSNSYATIGNNGNRAGISVNDSTTHGKNTSAPDDVINALFEFSDKYPVEVTLLVNPLLAVKNIQTVPGSIKVNNPVENNFMTIHFADFLKGQNITMNMYDVCGRELFQSTFSITGSVMSKSILVAEGVYFVNFKAVGYTTTQKVIVGK